MSVSTYNTLQSPICKNEQIGYVSCFQATSDELPLEIIVISTLTNPEQAPFIKAAQLDPGTGQFFDISFNDNGVIVFDISLTQELQCDFLVTTFKKKGTYQIQTTILEKNTYNQLFNYNQVINVVENCNC